ncbi:hypothetical protein DQ384_11985 [Sphaerisporangium album]|uniref:Histone acetyltransferase Rv0428c-like SH3 domain-containing protein n=1 Tax=Sphaerisporangium album TaxID=509200 RepID=A0A367FND4_9ACTN|nr:hypothetical protein [Sphaerisporangium album]RCG31419.1 hypothetical protein DQ384_11985 [Sphaerisporangium album]
MTSGFGGRLVISISPSDVGHRITVRRRDPEGFRDTVGVLESWAEGVLRVRKRDGTLVEIPERLVVAAKVVPGRPA